MERRVRGIGKVEGGKFETNSFVSSSPQKEQVKKKTIVGPRSRTEPKERSSTLLQPSLSPLDTRRFHRSARWNIRFYFRNL